MATTTKTPQKQAVANYLVPINGGTHAMSFQQDFSTPLDIDWTQQQIDGLGFNPSGFFINNINGGNVTINVGALDYKIVVAAGKQLCMQYPGPAGHTLNISADAAGTTTIVFVDFPVIPYTLP